MDYSLPRVGRAVPEGDEKIYQVDLIPESIRETNLKN